MLVGRLWFLQVMSSEVFAERAEANRIRILPIPARRGTIFDRKGRVLVTSKSSYNIVLSREDVKKSEIAAMTDLLASNLDIDRKWLAHRFEAAKYEAHTVWHHASLKGSELEIELAAFDKGHDDYVDSLGYSFALTSEEFSFGFTRH